MNGVQLTFFNFAGYLIPGIIFSLVLVPALYLIPELRGSVDAVAQFLTGPDGSVATSTIAALFLPGLAWCFQDGILISDTSALLIRPLRNQGVMFYQRNDQSLFLDLCGLDWQTAVIRNQRLREYLAQRATSGWDLYGSAARARMCMASGFAFIVAAPLYGFISALPCLLLVASGAAMVLLGMKRQSDYLATVDIVAYAEVHGGKEKGGAS